MWCVWNGNSLFSSPLGCQNGLQLCFSEYPIFTASDKVPRQQNSIMYRLLIQNDYLIRYLPLCSSRRVVIFTNDDHKREGGNGRSFHTVTDGSEGRKWKFSLIVVQMKCVSMEVARCYSGLLFLRPHKESPWKISFFADDPSPSAYLCEGKPINATVSPWSQERHKRRCNNNNNNNNTPYKRKMHKHDDVMTLSDLPVIIPM